jgi:vanillate O-demethylase monooxygenase subunit
MPYLLNTWYAAGWSEDVQPGALCTRTLLDQPVVMFRDGAGSAHALADRCPHRFAPLSLGQIAEDGRSVQCAYHGLRFGSTGECVHNPHGDGRIPPAAKVRAYPLVERHGLLWIWMGDAAKADGALIPDFSAIDPEHFHVGKGYLHAKANYLLEADNIMDLSHVEFLHPGTLGTPAVKNALTDIRQDGNTVWSMRQTVAETLTPFLYHSLGYPAGTAVDRWFDVRWNAPANLLLLAGGTPTGRPRSEGRESALPHLFTPETARTTHYWFAVSRPKAMGPAGAALVEKVLEGIKAPFALEDMPMLEAQQRSMGEAEFWSLKPVLLSGDGPAVRARRVLDGLIAEEQAHG